MKKRRSFLRSDGSHDRAAPTALVQMSDEEKRLHRNKLKRERYARSPEFKRYNLDAGQKWRKKYPEKTAARHRRAALKGYGLATEFEYEAMVGVQNSRCAICRTDKPGGRGRWHIDHCHKTGRVRQLLCLNCNVGLGKFKEDPNLLFAAGFYLAAHEAQEPVGPT